MRLLRLELSYIGPYAGKTHIDFTKLGDVFLICGTTGSGKSTIFDALAYALYGTAIGTRDLVSHHAGPEDEVFVDLEFKVRKELYRVWRMPARTVAKKRGSGTTDRPPQVGLWVLKGSNWTQLGDKQTDVEARVSDILGLSADEFTKIVLLPQGEFQRFLEMKTGDRTQILEKLFPVGIHGAISDLAKTRAKEADSKARDLDASIGSLEAELGPDPEKSLAADRDALEAAKAKETEAIKLRDTAWALYQAAELGGRAWAEYDAARQEADEIRATTLEAQSISSRLFRAEAALEAAQSIDAARKARIVASEADAARTSAHANIASLDERSPDIDAAKARIATLSEALDALSREEGLLSGRLSAWNRLTQARERLTRLGAEEKKALTASDSTRSLVEAAQTRLLALESSAADIDALSEERDAALDYKEGCQDAERLASEATRWNEESRRIQARIATETILLEAAEIEREAALARLTSLEEAIASQEDALAASRLASQLKEGLPCPVCGSTEHPSSNEPPSPSGMLYIPLTIPTDESHTPDERHSTEEVDSTKARQKARTDLAEAADKAARILATRTELSRNLSERDLEAKSFALAPPLNEARDALKSAHSRLKAALDALSMASVVAKETAQARLEVNRLRTLKDEALDLSQKLAIDRSAAQSALDEAATSAGQDDPGPLLEAVREQRKAHTAEREDLEAGISAWKKAKDEAVVLAFEADKRKDASTIGLERAEARALASLGSAGFIDEDAWDAASMPAPELAIIRTQVKTRAAAEASSMARLAAAERAVTGVQRPDEAAAKLAFDAADKAQTDARIAVDEAASVERDRASSLKTLLGLQAAREELRTRGDMMMFMSKLLGGETEGRRLSFKNYVLASYFELVVDRASARLREMSDGRYDMSVTESASGRGRVGLDLAVLDSFTGVARPASSLSGGEKFLASISLALGLSEVIVARSGGVSLDSIFIDEGFGSLDDETLDRAMAALDRVRGERVIGIVSHVAELRNRIPSHIEVRKTRSGSSLNIVC